MINTQISVERAAIPQPAKQSGAVDTNAAVQAFQALLQSALGVEQLPTGDAAEAQTQSSVEEQPTADLTEGKQAPNAEKPAKDEPKPAEEPNANLAAAVVPIQAEPAPELSDDLVEAVLDAGAPVILTAETQPMHPEPEQPVESTQVPEAQAAESQVPIIGAELIVEEIPQAEAVAATIVAEEPGEAQDRFDSMVARASEELQNLTAAEQPQAETDRPVEQARQEESLAETPTRLETEQPLFEQMVETEEPEETEDLHSELIAAQMGAEPVRGESAQFETVERESLFPTPAEQIETRIIENLDAQRMEFRMQLQPQELGRVDVRMVLQSGKLAVQIIASSAKAAEALRTQTEGLMASMRLANVDLESVQVVQQTQGQEEHLFAGFDMGGSNGSQDEPQDSGAGAGMTQTGAEQTAQSGEATLPEQLLNTAV